ncbi:MAG TPA: transposase [Actinomycetota bacterium]|nr:transposase [Actinomycetota bacterium]
MAYNFLPVERDQSFLLPPSMTDWLPEDHLAFFVLDVVENMDLRPFYLGYRQDGWGGAAHEPRMMVALLLYAYCVGERSSRKIERRCEEDIAFRVICGNNSPDHTTIARFRRQNERALASCFTEVLRLCAEAGLIRIGPLDGTKISANASLRANRSKESIEAEVAAILAEAAAVDGSEDDAFGEGVRGDELPESMRARQGRLARLAECKARLESQDVARVHEAELRRREAIREQTGHRPVGRPPKQRRPTKNSLVANPTDPDSRVMKTRYTYLQGYNAQVLVAEDQVIVAAAITQEPADMHQLHPMLERGRRELHAAKIEGGIGVVLADAGYYSERNLEASESAPERFLVAVTNEHDQRTGVSTTPGAHKGSHGLLMRDELAREEGRLLYAKRAGMVEPVFGQIKEARGARRFARRGLRACDAEWKLICATHNVLKLWRCSRT